MTPLTVLGVGAVTAIGLTAAQTCAAFRARLSGYSACIPVPPPGEPLSGARVPAAVALQGTPAEWFANLLSRALEEALTTTPEGTRCATFLCLPEASRAHPAMLAAGADRIVRRAASVLGTRAASAINVLRDGHASGYRALEQAGRLLDTAKADRVVIAGVDSLLGATDIARLAETGRLQQPGTPQGLVPGEGAACIVIARSPTTIPGANWIEFAGVGVADEPDSILTDRYANGAGLKSALAPALAAAGASEAAIALRVTDMNGERYRGWESAMLAARFYRTRRESLPQWHPASCTGDVGAAAAILGWIVAATALARGYAPGALVACEGTSESTLRGACIIRNAAGTPASPFRLREYARQRDHGAWPIVVARDGTP